jgi:hypothetical protein
MWAGCSKNRKTESGLQARPLIFNKLQTVLAKLCHNCDTKICYLFALADAATNQSLGVAFNPARPPLLAIERHEFGSHEFVRDTYGAPSRDATSLPVRRSSLCPVVLDLTPSDFRDGLSPTVIHSSIIHFLERRA